jgi:hypothetical protein
MPDRGGTAGDRQLTSPGGTNVILHLYQMLCTGSIPGTNEGYEQVQMPFFPVVLTFVLIKCLLESCSSWCIPVQS